MNKWKWLLMPCLVLGVASPADGQVGSARRYTEITGTGQTLFDIAIPTPIDGGGSGEATGELRRVLSRDLTLVGLFRVLDPRGFLADLRAEGTSIVPANWSRIGAQAVVKARSVREGGNLRVTWYLYDVSRGRSPVMSKTYVNASPRRIAHRFGNDIYHHFTNERGIFLSHIAFVAGNPRRRRSQVYVMDFDGYGARMLSRTGAQNVLPAWSPDGRIAYTSFLWRNPDLFVVSSGGGRAKRVSKRPGLNAGAAWSPDGSKIALTLSKDGNAEIYLINPSGAILRRLTHQPGIDTSPSWSPDGSQIAFVSNRAGSPQIYVMSSGGGGARRLTFSGNYNQEPSWCPRKDTPLVAFTGRDEHGDYDLFTVNVTTGELKRLTQGQGRRNQSPSWAPNGRLLVFSSSRGGLWIANADGLNQQQIYRGSAMTPSWSR